MVESRPDPELLITGPADANQAVLCLAGALCTATFYEELLAEPALAQVRLISGTLPGHGGTPAPADLSVEGYAAWASTLARAHGCDVVVGHSLGANVALEMVASMQFTGPVVLLAPSLSRRDESMFPRILDRTGRILGTVPFSLALKIIGPAMKGNLPAERHDALVVELRKNEPSVMRQHLRAYLAYLDRHGSVAARLAESRAPAWVVYGEKYDVGITTDEASVLNAAETVTTITVPGVGHFIANQDPHRVAQLVQDALAATS